MNTSTWIEKKEPRKKMEEGIWWCILQRYWKKKKIKQQKITIANWTTHKKPIRNEGAKEKHGEIRAQFDIERRWKERNEHTQKQYTWNAIDDDDDDDVLLQQPRERESTNLWSFCYSLYFIIAFFRHLLMISPPSTTFPLLRWLKSCSFVAPALSYTSICFFLVRCVCHIRLHILHTAKP